MLPNVSSTGDCPDSSDVATLVAQIKQLKIANETLTYERDALNVQKDALNVELMNLKAAQSGGGTEETPEDLVQEPAMSDEAARKRLERICKKKTDGTLSYK